MQAVEIKYSHKTSLAVPHNTLRQNPSRPSFPLLKSFVEIEFELTIVEAHKGAIQQLVCAFTLITSVMKMREHKKCCQGKLA